VFLPGQDLTVMNMHREEMEALEKELESLEKEMKKITRGVDDKVRAQFEPVSRDSVRRFIKDKNQNKEEVEKIFAEWTKTVNQETEKATAETGKKMEKRNKKLQSLFTAFSRDIEATEFHEPDIELRFNDLDMEKIQALKAHPLVQAVGKTDLSPASIRVVVG
jgi:hypothetical protein